MSENENGNDLFLPVLLGATRAGRKSARVADYLFHRLSDRPEVRTEWIDLRDFPFPLLDDRLPKALETVPRLAEFCELIDAAAGLLIVSPEYKNGYPAALKNALDYIKPQAMRRKPIGLCTVSAGHMGGINCLHQLRQLALALGGVALPESLMVANVHEVFTEEGVTEDEDIHRRAGRFLDELVWYTTRLSERTENA